MFLINEKHKKSKFCVTSSKRSIIDLPQQTKGNRMTNYYHILSAYFQVFVLLHHQYVLSPLYYTSGRYILYLSTQLSLQEETDFWNKGANITRHKYFMLICKRPWFLLNSCFIRPKKKKKNNLLGIVSLRYITEMKNDIIFPLMNSLDKSINNNIT